MKSKQTKAIIISGAVVLVVSCVCLALILAGGAGVSLFWPFGTTSKETATVVVEYETPEEETPTAVIEVETPTEEDEIGNDAEDLLSDELKMSMDKIEVQVIQIRGLQPTGPVERDLISEEELKGIVANDLFSDYTDEDVHQDTLILSALGLLAEDFDLKQFYLDLYSEQIAGFYDSELKAMYVVQGVGFGGNEKITYAHEYTHVLQDQVYGLDEGLGLNEESCEEDSERCAAVTALIEGDASIMEVLWFQKYGTEEDYQDLMEAYESYESPVLDSAPPYISADLYFPYEYGYTFVELLYGQGGFDAVDAVYVNPPVSTEQILHPELYPDDKPVIVQLPDLTDILGGDWSLADQNVMGEWYTYLILNKGCDEGFQLPETLASDAAEGWGGDAYAFYLNETTDDVVFILDAVWDTTQDADEFFEAFIQYADLRWEAVSQEINGYHTWSGEQGLSVLMQVGDRTLWVMAPDRELVETILSEIE